MKKLVIFIGIIIALMVAAVVGTFTVYNNGNCIKCGEPYEKTTIWREGTSYYKFYCPKCHTFVWVSDLWGE